MAITSAEIHNQSFSIDRKGYDVDEVDVFLEHVADEIDGLNQQIDSLTAQLGEDTFAGFDTPAAPIEEEIIEPEPQQPAEPVAAVDESVLAEKDARIAELEAQLEAKKADDNAIAQALIIAQRSADEILSNAKADAAATIKDAEAEADRILDKAENDRQKVLDAIKKLEEDREDAREEYRDLLTDYITDATRKLAEIGEKAPSVSSIVSTGAHSHVKVVEEKKEDVAPTLVGFDTPATIDGSDAYSVSATATAPASPAVTSPVAAKVEKDFSGFGDAADAFDIDDLD